MEFGYSRSGSPKFWYALISPPRPAVTTTRPQAVADWLPVLFASYHSQDEVIDDATDDERVDKIPDLVEDKELEEMDAAESEREWPPCSSSWEGSVWSEALFLWRGGHWFFLLLLLLLLLLVGSSSTTVGSLEAGVGFGDFGCWGSWSLLCFFDSDGSCGISYLLIPQGQGIATDTSLHWKCSWDLVVIIPLALLLAPTLKTSSRLHKYTWESSLAHTTYLPSAVNDAAIWLLVFL